MARLFTGLEVPRDVSLALSMKKGGLPGARWIDPENYHVTLRFIGDVPPSIASEIAYELGNVAPGGEITVNFLGLGNFGKRPPRTLFAAIGLNDGLARLQAAHERVAQIVGISADSRRFTPHVTLARLHNTSQEDLARYLGQTPPLVPLQFTATRFCLYSARQSVGGGPYAIEQAYPLGYMDGQEPEIEDFSPF